MVGRIAVSKMHNRSPDFCRRNATAAAAVKFVVAAVSAIGLALGSGISRSAAQGAPSEVAYVEAVSGRVVATAQGGPMLLDALDIVSDRTRLDLQANSELRICHYRTRKLLTLTGPLRASVSASGVTAESGPAIAVSAEPCAAPVVSTFQGGIVSRTIAVTTTNVPLRPSIKVVNHGTKPIRQISLWDGLQQKMPVAFEHNAARPVLDDGQTYLLVIEQSDNSELKMMLRAVAGARSGPLIVVVQ
jgi:hypothetical protein